MMKLRIIILVLTLISSCTLEDDSNLANTEIQAIKEKLQAREYVGSNLHELYNDFGPQITSTTWTDEPPGKLAGVIFQLNGKNSIEVDLIEIPDTLRFDINRSWTIEKVGMSKIEFIKLISEGSKIQEYKQEKPVLTKCII